MAPKGREVKQSEWSVNATITVLIQNMAPKEREIKQSEWSVNATITVHDSKYGTKRKRN